MSHLRSAAFLLIAFLVVGTAFAQEQAAKPDPRLEQKVTYEAKNLQVRKVLEELSAKTGVELRAGSNAKDWRVRDRRMNLFVKDVTLAQLQKSVETLMNFRWSRGGEDGKWYYRLWQDRKSESEEDAMVRKAAEEHERKMQQRRQEALDAFSALDNLTPEQIEKLKDENPYLYLSAKTGIAKGFGEFFRNTPGAIDTMMSGQEGNMRFGDLSPAAQQGLRSSLQGVEKIAGRFGDTGTQKLLNNLPNATIQFNRSREFLGSTPVANAMLGDIHIRAEGGGHFDMPFFDPNSNIAKAFGKMAAKVIDGADPKELGQGMQLEMMAAISADLAREAKDEKEEEQPADPELDKKIALKIPGDAKLDQALADFTKASSLSVVSDSFPTFMPSLVSVDEKEISAREALDKIAKGFNCRWRKEGSVIRIQSRDWFKKRAAQIPDAWIEAWIETLKTTNTLDIDDLAFIASLSSEQQAFLMQSGREYKELMPLIGSIGPSREMLRFYGLLDTNQRHALAGEGGLSAHVLSLDQWSLLSKQVRSKNAALMPDPPVPLIMKMSRKEEGKRFIYTIAVSSPDSDQTASWDIRTPFYSPPPPETEKPQPEAQQQKKE